MDKCEEIDCRGCTNYNERDGKGKECWACRDGNKFESVEEVEENGRPRQDTGIYLHKL